jgi:pyruvate,orthophosphate dikinase
MSSNSWSVLLDGQTEVTRDLVGGKAKSIADMQALGLPVPPAFAITTKACLAYLESGAFPAGLEGEIDSALAWLEGQIGRSFGQGGKRLSLSVRSGAAISMPGMMDTVLNLGIDDDGEAALAEETGMADFARDTHRRFVELYSAIVLKQPIELDVSKEPSAWRDELAALGAPLPGSAREQLMAAIQAVFDSWNTRRAKRYRQHNNIPDDLGTAVTVQAMIFGNLDERSGTGVLFSRNPLTGENVPYGEYLPRAQGEDVVSGKFTPLPLDAMKEREPQAHAALLEASALLERQHGDVQDIEFTVQTGQLYLLQSRSAKRAPQAAIRFAVDMVEEGRIDPATALSRVTAEQAVAVLLPRLANAGEVEPIAQGEGACPGAASGILVGDPDEAEKRAAAGEDVILVRKTTSPDDVHGMIAARGVVTEQGGSTSHAAVVSRALGRPCVVGTGAGLVDRVGQQVTIDGGEGKVFAGLLPTEIPNEAADPYLGKLIEWLPEAIKAAVLPIDADGSGDAMDIDGVLADGSTDQLAQAVGGASSVKGRSLGNPDIVRGARQAGASRFYTTPVLPAMLTLLEEQVG